MAKQGGLGANLYVAGYDVSGDIGAIDTISGPVAVLDVTAITQSATARIGGLRSGQIDFTAFFDPAVGAVHERLSALPTADVQVCCELGTNLGDRAACMVAKQLNYDGTRATDGAYTFKTQAQSNGFGLEWGTQLTAGKRTDGAAANGTAVDYGAPQASALDLQAYLHVFAFTGTSVTVKLQDSADNVTFADVVGAGFTAATGITSQRIATSGQTIRRYVRAVTTGTFSNAVFSVAVVRNEVSVVF